MRNVLAIGAAILLVGSMGVAGAQERLQSNQSGMGVGTGVGDVSGSASRVTTFDSQNFLERLSQAETVYGRVFAIDFAQNRLMVETGGAGNVNDQGQEGKAGAGARTVMTLYIDSHSNIQSLKQLNVGDDVSIQVREQVTDEHPFGTGKKLVQEAYVVNVAATMRGFGGLGQRPDPQHERALSTDRGGMTGGIVGSVLPGEIKTGLTTTVGEYTGAAPCWNCEPQPGWGYGDKNKSDYGSDYTKPDLTKE
jgi:hypothetical protein